MVPWFHQWYAKIIIVVYLQVQIYDQIIFESLKSPGQYFHVSTTFKIDHFTNGWASSTHFNTLKANYSQNTCRMNVVNPTCAGQII